VRAFHKRFYGSGSALLTLVGDFDPAEVEKQANALFGDWKSAEPYSRIAKPIYPRPKADLTVNVPDKANAYWFARSHFELQDNAPDFAAFTLANYLLGRSESSRLWMRIRETDGLSYDVRTVPTVSAFENATTFTASAIMAPANLPKVRKAFDEELARALKDGFTEAEVKLGRAGLLQLRKLSRAQDDGLVGTLTSNVIVGRNMSNAAQIDAKLAAMSAAEVNAALRKYIKPDDFYFVSAGSFDKK
jgi:zinc protease